MTKIEHLPVPSWALTKRFLSRQRYTLAGAALLLVLLMLLLWQRTAWEVCLDNETIAYTLDRDQVQSLARGILAADGRLEESNANLSFHEVKRSGVELTTYEELKDRLTCALLQQQPGWSVQVGGRDIISLSSQEEAEAVLAQVLTYFPPEDGAQLKKARIKEKTHIAPCIARKTTFLSVAKAVAYLIRGTNETRDYKVKSGDSLWSIAVAHDMDVDDIKAANPGISENLQIDQELSLVVPTPYLNVVCEEEKTVLEPIPFETNTVRDHNLYTYERRVRVAGKQGSRRVTYNIVKENGEIVEKNIINEEIEQEPSTQIVAVGTKEPQIVATGRYTWPLSRGGQITSRYGMRGGRLHAGVDIGAPTGTPIVAADNGVVTAAGWNGGYGKCVTISHGASSTVYGHLSQIMVKQGQTVEKGQTIGLLGSTGISTGPHLHFEIREGGSTKNPLQYFEHR